jgi:hypothetical protein
MEEYITEYHQKLSVGDYKVDLPLEWCHLMRVIIIMQLRGLKSLVVNMKVMASSAARESQFLLLLATEKRVGNMATMLQRSGIREIMQDIDIYQLRSGHVF